MSEHIVGRTQFAGLLELIQVYALHRRSVSITVVQKGQIGEIVMKEGKLFDITCGELRGEEGLYEMLRWANSYFEAAPLNGEAERSLASSNTTIMMRVAAQMQTVETGPPELGLADRVTGSLRLMSLAELLQLFEINHRDAVVKLKRHGERGYVHFRNGRIVHATLGRIYGNEAVLDLMLWEDAEFRVEFSRLTVVQTVTGSVSELVMEGSRRLDVLTHLVRKEEQRKRDQSPTEILYMR